MGYFKTNYYSDFLEHREKYGTADSVSSERGSDNKKNNSSEYNHEYYMKNKEKWKDNESSSSDSDKEEKEFDIDAAAMDVIRGKYGNGQERKDKLGEDYAIVQKRVNELMATSAGKEAKEEASEEKEKENSRWDEIRDDYLKNGKNVKHYEDLSSILLKDIL